MEKLQAYKRAPLKKHPRSCSPVAAVVAVVVAEEEALAAVAAEEVVEDPAVAAPVAVKAQAAWAVVPAAPGKAVLEAAKEAKAMAPSMERDKAMEPGPKHTLKIAIKHVIELIKATKTVSKNLL